MSFVPVAMCPRVGQNGVLESDKGCADSSSRAIEAHRFPCRFAYPSVLPQSFVSHEIYVPYLGIDVDELEELLRAAFNLGKIM